VTPPPDLLEFLRRCGVALCLAGEAASRIPDELEAVASAYGFDDVEFLVVPTGVFVRVVGDEGVTVDFMNADGPPLRLDQVDSLFKLMTAVKAHKLTPDQALDRLETILDSRSRFRSPLRILGHAVLTVGLGLLVVRDGRALISLAVLGLAVGVLRIIAEKVNVLSLALPVAAAMLVTGLAYKFSPDLGLDASALIIPPLVAFLPGTALTLGAQEIATRSMISGASRMVSGIYMLLLLSFGIYAGWAIADTPQPPVPPSELGWWGPLAGVVVFGIGMFVNSSAPKGSLPWLLVMLLITFGAQQFGGWLGGAYFSAFAGGLAVVPIATLVQRLKGPPAQVAILPAFWLLVPGALGLAGVSGLVSLAPGTQGGVLGGPVNAFLTVVAVALGVLVGSSLTATATARRPRFRFRRKAEG
jgi:uncharacterized membrane protein YjjP (DUF1212 family)